MRHWNRWISAPFIVAAVQLSACQAGPKVTPKKIHAAEVVHIEGSALSRVTLTPKAAERLGIQTATVQEARVGSGPLREASAGSGVLRKVVPYAAVLYDAHGDTWVYTNPEPLVFIRHPIKVDYIVGEQAVLSDGPPVRTQIVTVGGAELFGAEFEIGH